MRKIIIAVSGLVLFIFAYPVFAYYAASPSPCRFIPAGCMSVPYGWYVEGNVGSTKLTNKSYTGSSSSSGIGGSAIVGYKFMPFFALEGGYTRYANTNIDVNNVRVASDQHDSYHVEGKGIWPFASSGMEAFAKLGYQRLNTKTKIDNSALAAANGISSGSHTHYGLYMGIGLQYYFSPELAVVGQWARAQGNSATGTLDLLSIGLSFIID